jgi:ribonuclease-3
MYSVDLNIAQIEMIFGYTWVNKLLCAEALNIAAPGEHVIIAGTQYRIAKNERLELLGDSIMAAVLAKICYDYFDGNGISSLENLVFLISTVLISHRQYPLDWSNR